MNAKFSRATRETETDCRLCGSPLYAGDYVLWVDEAIPYCGKACAKRGTESDYREFAWECNCDLDTDRGARDKAGAQEWTTAAQRAIRLARVPADFSPFDD